MMIPTEPIGSIPRSLPLIVALATVDAGDPSLEPLYDSAIKDAVARFEATGSPVITDGEQRKFHNFGTFCGDGLSNIAPDGFQLPFVSHVRRWPPLTSGPFRYKRYADSFLKYAQPLAHVPVKEAVISPSALSLMYPPEGFPDCLREQFIDDLRLAVKIDLRGELLHRFIDLGLSRFPKEEQPRIGVHTCPGGDRESTHSADVDYSALLPSLFQLKAGNFYIAPAGEKNPRATAPLPRSARASWALNSRRKLSGADSGR